jgi:hypothetical protein
MCLGLATSEEITGTEKIVAAVRFQQQFFD